jgi:PAS domain S-box-containing protein
MTKHLPEANGDAPSPQRMRVDLPKLAMDHVPLGMITADLDGRLTYANAAMLRIAARTTWEGLNVRDLFQGEDLEKVLDGIKRRADMEGGEYPAYLTRPDGSKVHISITAFPEGGGGHVVHGALGLVRDLTLDDAYEAMVKHLEGLEKGHDLLEAVAAVLKPLVPFEQFKVVRLNRDRTCLRTIYPSNDEDKRGYRWWQVPHGLRRMLDGHDIIRLGDVRRWYEDCKREGLAPDPAIEKFLAQGFTSTMSLPVFVSGRQVASIVLARKGGAAFTDEEEQVADSLPLAEAASVALRHETESDLNFLIELIHDIAAAYESVDSICKTVVDRIALHHRWDYVSIHQVDVRRGFIRLVAQYSERPEHESKLERLPLGKGLLGETHRTRRLVRVDDTEHQTYFKDVYVAQPAMPTRSEMCVPIGKDALWILNIEDLNTNAFCPEDENNLTKVANSLDALLRCTLEANYRAAVMDSAKDAILLVDNGGDVFETNGAAEELFGRPRAALVGLRVAELFEDGERTGVLQSHDSFANHSVRMMRLADSKPEPVNVLLSVARLPDETPGRVFIASDLSEVERSDELDVARDIYREIAGQVKTPMSLAISWLRRFSQERLPAAEDVPQKVLQQLQKAEVTLDRMLLIERGRQTAERFPTLLPVQDLICQSLDDLPERERTAIALSNDAPAAWVRADAFELRFCIQTVLTYLLRLATKASRVEMRTWEADGHVQLQIGGPADAMRAPGVQTKCRGGQAVAELALGRETLSALAGRNGGKFTGGLEDGRAWFSFSFPSAQSGDMGDAK